MLAGRRDRHSLAAQQNPHEGEGARLAAMAQEAEATLTSLQAMSLTHWLASLVCCCRHVNCPVHLTTIRQAPHQNVVSLQVITKLCTQFFIWEQPHPVPIL